MTSPLRANSIIEIDSNTVLKGHSQGINSVAFSANGQLVASGSYDHTIRLWDATSGTAIATLNGHALGIHSTVFSPDGTILASGSSDNTIKLWDVGSRTQIDTIERHSGTVYSLAFSPDGTYLASGSGDKTIQLWDVKSRSSIGVLYGHSDDVRSVAFSPDGKQLASGSDDSRIQLWDIKSRASIATMEGHSGLVLSVAFSPSGEHLASGSTDRTICLWNAVSGARTAVMRGHSHEVQTIAFSPNGKYLASGSYDKTIQFWDIASKTSISTLDNHLHCVRTVAFSPDGARFASGSYDETVRIWNLSSKVANDPQGTRYTLNPIAPAQSTIDNQQDTATSATSLNSLNKDTIESISLTTSTLDDQQNLSSPSPTSFPLKNDITGTVSLEESRSIGYGGFGELVLGIHRDHGKVALKTPRRLLDEGLIRRFLREVDLWCSVSHPHILSCLGMCRVGLNVYVVSPYIENGDVSSCMARGKALNRSKLLFEVAEALTHLHHRGIIHGDVKAQNILLSDDGSALLCDFGLAKAFDTMKTSTESKGAGSVRWMPPELFLGESRSMASDVYSLGITIAEVLSGRTPFDEISENVAVMFHVVRDGRPLKEPSHSPEGKSYAVLWETAEKCWAKDDKARPSMAQVLGMLFPLTREKI